METAKNASATGLQKMFMNRDTDDGIETDFVIETGDGDEIKVHSWVLRLRQSDFFDTLLSSDFKERREGKVTLAASTETVTQFVKFLYAFELGLFSNYNSLTILFRDVCICMERKKIFLSF